MFDESKYQVWIDVAGTSHAHHAPPRCQLHEKDVASPQGFRYSLVLRRTRGGAVWQLVGLITRRSQVQILPPQPARKSNVFFTDAGWSSLAARRAHNPKVAGSNPAPATNDKSRTARSKTWADKKNTAAKPALAGFLLFYALPHSTSQSIPRPTRDRATSVIH